MPSGHGAERRGQEHGALTEGPGPATEPCPFLSDAITILQEYSTVHSRGVFDYEAVYQCLVLFLNKAGVQEHST